MTDSSGTSGFLPTVVFTSPNTSFTSAQRIAQLAALGITGFYEADFADNITTISASAFSSDKKVIAVSINKVTTIGDSAFIQCNNLRSITLDCGVDASGRYLLTTINTYAFGYCNSLRSIYIPDTVTVIPVQMCYNCSNLEVAVMGYGCDRTGDTYNRTGTMAGYAFGRCSKLSYVVIPETISNIGNYSFDYCYVLASVYILGRPTITSLAFNQAMGTGATYYYDNSASYTDLTAVTSTSPFPANATKRPYREIDLSAGGAATLTSTHVNSAIGAYNSYWKGKILSSVTSLADNCFRGQTAGTDGIGTTNYSNMIGLSFPPALTSIGYAAFCNSNGTTSATCRVGGFYIPNSVATFGVSGVSGDTFWLTDVSGQTSSTTKQFVFQSGRTSPITTLPARMFQYTSAMAMVIPTFTNIQASCFQFAKNIQYFNFFQKNAYNTLTKLDGNTADSAAGAFSNCFNALTSHTQYLYIPKAVATISTSVFLSSTNPLFITVYSSNADGSTGTGLCATVNDLTSAYFSGTVAPTFYLIDNYYDANGVTLGTFVPTTGTYHVLFSSGVGAINNKFVGSTTLKTITISDTVADISGSAFSGCTGLVNVNMSPNSNLTNIGNSAFSGDVSLASFFVPNSLRSISKGMFAGCISLETVVYGNNPGIEYIDASGFYNATNKLANMFIPSSIVSIGSQAFINSTTQNNLASVKFGAGSRLKSIGGGCFGSNTPTYAARYLTNLALPNSVRCIGTGLFGGLVSDAQTSNVFRNAFTLTHSDDLILPSSLESLSNWFLFTDSSNIDISNVYLPKSITNVAGPRNHCGYTTSGLGGNEFSSTTIGSLSGSLLYLPSELSTYTPSSLPGLNRARSYYKTVSYTANPLVTLSLGGTVANTTDAMNTTQIHADIKEGVTVIGNGTTGIDMNGAVDGSLNLISVNIPSTVTDISANAFNGCSALAYVTFSENSKLTNIRESAFLGCAKITDITLPDTVTTIGANAFKGCNNLDSISIPYNVTSIGPNAFNIIKPFKSPAFAGTVQLGGIIEKESTTFGTSISMNSDGTIVAIGELSVNGHVRVYEYKIITDTTWANYNAATFNYSGISPNNKPVVVDGGDALPVSGKKYWVQMGGDIDGERSGDRFCQFVSLSADGTTIAIGANLNDGSGNVTTDNRGHVRVYKYQTIADATWTNYNATDFSYNGISPFDKPIVVDEGDANPIANKKYWVQLGVDIDGEAALDESGFSVSLSMDGTTVAIGAYFNDGTPVGADRGHVRAYKYDVTKTTNVTDQSSNDFGPIGWRRLGQDIDGEASSDYSGYSVSLSSDGTTVAIGAYGNDGTGDSAGHVRVYKYDVNKTTNVTDQTSIDYGPIGWRRLGRDIDGEASSEYSGQSVSLSADGTIVAIGAIYNNGNANNSGHVRVYKYDVTKATLVSDQNSIDYGPIGWRRLGRDIDGKAASNNFGTSVSLSSDGTIVAIGARAGGNLGSNTGYVGVYKYDSTKLTSVTQDQGSNDFGPVGWRRIGQDLDSNTSQSYFGAVVSLSRNGNAVAVGGGLSGFQVRVYGIGQFTPVRLHQRLYNDISSSLPLYFSDIVSTSFIQVIPALQLTNTLNPAKLTISQINNIYIRYRQLQLTGFATVTVSASSGGILTASDINTALSTNAGLVHLVIGTNVTSIASSAAHSNTRIYSVAISQTVVTIADYAFYGCTNLTYLSFHPDSVCTTIGVSTFSNTIPLTNKIFDIALPDSLTTIGSAAFGTSNNLTSVCIPNRVTSLGSNAFGYCTKLTSVALPNTLPAATSSYFNTNGSSVAGITFTSYSINSAIPHFKLSDYSMPNGIVQNVVDSAVTYIDHRAYAYYPDITLYAVTTNKRTQTAGPYTYNVSNVQTPITPAMHLLTALTYGINTMFPIYRSIPDLNAFSGSSTAANWADNTDDYYILMPGYSICIYNNLYDEENVFVDAPTFRYYDNEFGLVPLNITVPAIIANTTSSILIMYNGRILSKSFAN